jgi:hypothetical protein
MCHALLDDNWAMDNFGGAYFRDKRLSDRLITIASAMIALPNGSIPQQMEIWSDTKACYAFLRNAKVSHNQIQAPHRKRVLEEASKTGKVVLFAQDTSEVDYTSLEATTGLGYIGNHKNKGLMFHNCLAIEYNETNSRIIGLANQQVWTRKNASLNKNETRAKRNKRGKESDVWLKNIQQIGSPPEGCKWVSIGDRANDIFEFFAESKKLGWETVARASQDRNIKIGEQEATCLSHMRLLGSMGTMNIKIRKAGDSTQREILLNVSWEQVELQPPARLKRNTESVSLSVIRCWNTEEDLEWILYSSIPVNNLEEAIEKVKWYANRWVIEEYHKCLKTGCRIEASQLENGKGLKSLLGILGVIAVYLLQLRNISREEPERPACEVVDGKALQIIRKRFKLPLEVTVKVFWYSVARLGGFIGRKSDGEPGWQTLWKGWLRLLDMLLAVNCFEFH